jgi:hypothetical protein
MRDLGSPAHSLGWFERVFETFAGSACLLTARLGAAVKGGAVLLQHKGVISAPWISSLRQAFSLYPNDLLYWEAIKHAVCQECLKFDFGRSTSGSGNHTYKLRWGCEEQPLYWQYSAIAGGEPKLPDESNTVMAMATSVWKRLPLTLANLVGPIVRRGITK